MVSDPCISCSSNDLNTIASSAHKLSLSLQGGAKVAGSSKKEKEQPAAALLRSLDVIRLASELGSGRLPIQVGIIYSHLTVPKLCCKPVGLVLRASDVNLNGGCLAIKLGYFHG